MDKSLKKIVYLRGHTFYDSIITLIKDKNEEITNLRNEVSKLMIFRKDNEILEMKVKNYEED